MFIFFQYQCTCTFPYHKAIAFFIKWPGCLLRYIVSFRQGLRGIKSAYRCLCYRRFRSPCHHNCRLAKPYGIKRIDNGGIGRRACGHRTVVRPMQLMAYRYGTGSNVHDHLGDEIGIEPRRTIACIKLFQLLLKGADTTIARCPYHAHFIALLLRHCSEVKPGVFYRLVAGSYAVLGVQVILFQLLFFYILQRIKILYLAAKLCLEFGCVKFRKGCSTTLAGNYVFPEFSY